MSTISFDVGLFRTAYPAFANTTLFPDPMLQLYWDTATNFISNQYPQCNGMALGAQTLALNLMTAHLAQLMTNAASGQVGGVVIGSTIDKISVQLATPPFKSNWQWWLQQTAYGAQLLALLTMQGVGGLYFGGFPTAGTMRR